MATEVKVSPGGVGFFGLMFLIFLTLKLVGTIDWSWWLVCLPLYGPPLLVVGILVLFLTLFGVASLFVRK